MATKEHEMKKESDNVLKARSVLRGQDETPEELLKLAKKLKKERAFGLARRILAKARRDPRVREIARDEHVTIIQQHALCTYKDPDLPAFEKLDRALEILQETASVTCEALSETKDQETLGIAGAIHKRKWELDSQKQHLEQSLAYYLRGYEQGVEPDRGYTAINAAFVLDLLADQEEMAAAKAGADSDAARFRREKAREIREDIVSKLPELPRKSGEEWLERKWWFLVTIAEAYFGLKRFQEALEWLRKAKALAEIEHWEFESTAKQLITLACLQDKNLDVNSGEDSEPLKVVGEFLKQDNGTTTQNSNKAGLRSARIGKVGLALSGGGFRASLFHIGVLARLAELDVLRSVEVLSCVSGGSIIGAHYYLEVRKLLESKRDADITREDYIEIVKRIEEDFLAGVQENLRMRVMSEWTTNLKMIFWRDYTRTQRMGELFEEEIYSRVKDCKEGKPRWLDELFVNPADKPEGFKPRADNWARNAKVPVLILNATTLNTGHNWQFTASWMGEPPAGIDSEIDGNDRLRRMYYREAPEKHRKVRLGHAVAASACVPGLFDPLALADLYPDRIVRLVDGGVYDNQGVAGLLEEDCTVLLVSDASGQMESQNRSKDGFFSVLLRSNNILQARVRSAEYHELDARRRSSLARGLMFVHLKKDLDVDPVDWIGCEDPHQASEDARPVDRRGHLTSYGIHKEVQNSLAAIRTDLDSFSDLEAYALMTSGYRMTEHEFPRCIKGFPPPSKPESGWKFLEAERYLNRAAGPRCGEYEVLKLLEVAGERTLKVWRIKPSLQLLAAVIVLAVITGLGWICSLCWSTSLLTVGGLVNVALAAIAALVVGPTIVKLLNYRKTLTQVGAGIFLALFGFFLAKIHLKYFDKQYLEIGRIPPKTGK